MVAGLESASDESNVLASEREVKFEEKSLDNSVFCRCSCCIFNIFS
jgi:hypothetical protein